MKTEQAQRCIPMDKWDRCKAEIKPEMLAAKPCFAGLDIGAMSDFTAFVLVFPHDDGEPVDIPIDSQNPEAGTRTITRRSFSVLPHFWLPERPVVRDSRMQATIAAWQQQGFIRTTGGSTVDYDVVLDDIVRMVAPFQLEGIGFDRGFQGSQMGNNLMKHFGETIVQQVPQGILSMNAPFRELLELLMAGRLHHDGNPVLRWMAGNVAAEEKSGLIKPSKDQSSEKIDGISALTMAMFLAMKSPSTNEKPFGLLI